MTHRSHPDVRTAELLEVALKLAAAEGWRTLTRDGVARAAGVSGALVTVRLGTMDQIRRSVMRAAVKHRVVAVVAEGLCHGSVHARKADSDLRALAQAWVVRA